LINKYIIKTKPTNTNTNIKIYFFTNS